MRLLLLNPNTTAELTSRMAEVARGVASPATEIVPLTAPRGVPYIATRAEAAIGSAVALEMLAEHAGDVDAVMIAAFGDPGLGGARELSEVPVVGMAEAAMLTACMLGRRFSIVTFARALRPWYQECVDYHGLAGRLASVRVVDAAFAAIETVQEDLLDLIVAACNSAVGDDDADVVVLGGAPLAGLAASIRERVPVPLVDGVAAAVRQAETLALLRPVKATAGSFRRPEPKLSRGLAPALAHLLATR